MRFRVFFTPLVSKGGEPTSKLYKRHPNPHTSASRPWELREATSGEMKLGVPHIVMCFSSGRLSWVAKPKSAIFWPMKTQNKWKHGYLSKKISYWQIEWQLKKLTTCISFVSNKLDKEISRWRILWACRYFKPSTTCRIILHTSFSVKALNR